MTRSLSPEPVVKDRDRFKRFAPDRRAVMPPDSGEPVPFVATAVLMDARIEALRAAHGRSADTDRPA